MSFPSSTSTHGRFAPGALEQGIEQEAAKLLAQGWTGKKPTRNRLDAADILLEKGTEGHTGIHSAAAAAAGNCEDENCVPKVGLVDVA